MSIVDENIPLKKLYRKLNPLRDWNQIPSKLGKLWLIIKAPVVFVLNLTIPVVDLEEEDMGYCRILHAIQLSLSGLMVCWFFQFFHYAAVIISLVTCIVFLAFSEESK